MSRSELHDWECAIESLCGDNADKMLVIAQDIYDTAFVRGKNYISLEQTRWIPVTERLPKLDEEACSKDVLISLRETTWDIDECQEVHITKIAYYDDNAISSDGIYMDTEGWVLRDGSTLTTDEVIAWQPLPQIYKESEE